MKLLNQRKQHGFSLVELMIALTLGLVISGAVIQVLVSSSVTNKLNQAVAQVQESGRFIMARLSAEFYEVGRYDQIVANVDTSVDIVAEAAYVENHPIAIAGDFPTNNTLGSVQTASGGSDKLVVSLLNDEDCTGNSHGYAGSEFHVVNHYFVSGSTLKCTGYDGRVLLGLKSQSVDPVTVTLLDNVESFQVQFGVSDVITSSNGQAVTYVTADDIDNLRALNQQVVSLRWAIMLKSYQNEVRQTQAQKYALLNEASITMGTAHYYQVFTKTLALRNMKNFVRSSR
ncbi:prepilin-type N-terminal cleavage/methylation domain-containing protein [Alteromonas portus]|uniref:Prepilin-type N-terminal cleavage/methylation domain-containing protein n=1 Tax=Alteromonas portus TaxID=2565549 RepID=A0A4U0ZAX4_9ALTE|nr:PilW family protein [Alteromonas portus]TKB02939.1 prepilin-type N-terminal cleavage/methylation domain-containing protein [Alteromonas portus]